MAFKRSWVRVEDCNYFCIGTTGFCFTASLRNCSSFIDASIRSDSSGDIVTIKDASRHPLWLALNRKIGNRQSLNDFVRPVQHRLRNRQADLLGCLEIDHELELCWLLHREVRRLGALRILST